MKLKLKKNLLILLQVLGKKRKLSEDKHIQIKFIFAREDHKPRCFKRERNPSVLKQTDDNIVVLKASFIFSLLPYLHGTSITWVPTVISNNYASVTLIQCKGSISVICKKNTANYLPNFSNYRGYGIILIPCGCTSQLFSDFSSLFFFFCLNFLSSPLLRLSCSNNCGCEGYNDLIYFCWDKNK